MSRMPTVKPLCKSQKLTNFCRFEINILHASGPFSIQIMCTKDPDEAPTVFLQTIPVINSPCRIITLWSDLEKVGSSPRFLPAIPESRSMLTSGTTSEKICFPVHIGFGRKIAGRGNLPSQCGTQRSRFIAMARSNMVSRLVNLDTANRESCTIPITGRFPCGDTICLGLNMMWRISARVSWLCARCKFISSPSKSALYGDVTLKLRRKVEYGRILTRCPIILILCKLGCRLKITKSSSNM
mmetsp:Transcript_64074/g.171453  ORF Transcript_64074/g.171453 Transcript_64074/m.171453 type:complete len:241 (+) Transcript_64074:3802-4524(+)